MKYVTRDEFMRADLFSTLMVLFIMIIVTSWLSWHVGEANRRITALEQTIDALGQTCQP